MIAFPEMLVAFAEDAGIIVPENIDDYSKENFPHWHVYVTLQLGARMPNPWSHGENAKLIASIPDDEIRSIRFEKLLSMGFEI